MVSVSCMLHRHLVFFEKVSKLHIYQTFVRTGGV
jgi:hypothetical protein